MLERLSILMANQQSWDLSEYFKRLCLVNAQPSRSSLSLTSRAYDRQRKTLQLSVLQAGLAQTGVPSVCHPALQLPYFLTSMLFFNKPTAFSQNSKKKKKNTKINKRPQEGNPKGSWCRTPHRQHHCPDHLHFLIHPQRANCSRVPHTICPSLLPQTIN